MFLPHYLSAAGWLAGWVLLTRTPRLPSLASAAEGAGASGAAAVAGCDEEGPLTIVIPARNEAERLPHLLQDLAASRPQRARILVVDDRSEDGTAELARRFAFVEVLEAPAPEEGWTGKTWACHVGAEHVKSGTLVFLDADVRLGDGALAKALAAWRSRGGLLTVWPYHLVVRPYEHLSAMPTLITLMSVGCGSLLPPRAPQGAFGPLMITSKDAYASVGGHAAIRGDIVDDFALAERYAKAGQPVANFTGGRDITFRMYPDGVRGLVEGWTKNFARGAGRTSWWRVLLIMFWLTCSIGALTWAHGLRNPASVVLYGMFALQMFLLFRQVGRFGLLDALLYPLHVGVLSLILLRSLWRTHVRRSVTWRGREVPLGAVPPVPLGAVPPVPLDATPKVPR